MLFKFNTTVRQLCGQCLTGDSNLKPFKNVASKSSPICYSCVPGRLIYLLCLCSLWVQKVPSTCTVQLLHLQHALAMEITLTTFKPTSYCILKFYFPVAFQPLNSQHNSALVFHPCFYSLDMETEIFPSQSVKKSLITKTESLWNIFLETHWNVV